MQQLQRIHRMSRMYLMTELMPPNIPSKSKNLLLGKGLMKTLESGTFAYLPMLQRSIIRTSDIIKRFMYRANAEEISLPALVPTRLWKESGRFETYRNNLFVMDDKLHILGPTFEESITHIAKVSTGLPEKCMPLRYFQIGRKFRNEAVPKNGLLRALEFIMKDMYTFDVDKTSALQTYEEINDIYTRLFKFIGVPFVKVEADATSMGGHVSQEYHFLSDIGEGRLQSCRSCNHFVGEIEVSECPKCKSMEFEHKNSIEIGHTFYLGDTYSRKQEFFCAQSRKPIEMGCYGIGVTRLIGSAIEVLSTETHIRWPIPLAPYYLSIITPEKRSKAFRLASHHFDDLHAQLNAMNEFNDNILVDDRSKIVLGERVREAQKLGIPLIIIIGKSASDPNDVKFELHYTYENKTVFLPFNELLTEVRNYMANKLNDNI